MGRYLSSTQWLRWTLSYPIEEQGHSASQWLRGSSSFPNRSGDPSSGNTCRAEHYYTAGYANMVAGSGRLPTPHALLVDFQQRGDLRGADTGGDPSTIRMHDLPGRAPIQR